MSLSIVNPGFENILLGDGNSAIKDTPGWQIYDPSNLLENQSSKFATLNPGATSYDLSFGVQAAEGNNVASISLENPVGSGVVGISQSLSEVLKADKTYTVAVNVGNPATSAGFPGYAVQLWAGGNLLAQDRNTKTVKEGKYTNSTLSYTSTRNDQFLGQPLTIRLLNLLADQGKEVHFDNVKLDVSSPDILNAGFEHPALAPDSVDFNGVPGWTIYDPSNVLDGNDGSGIATYNSTGPNYQKGYYPIGVPQGEKGLGIYSEKAPGSGVVGIRQILPKVLEANTEYTLKVDIGNIRPSPEVPILAGFPGYAIQLLAGGEVVAQDVNGLTPPEGLFKTTTISYTTSANPRQLGKPLEIRVLNTQQFAGSDVNFDFVRLDTNPATSTPTLKLPPGFFNEAYYLQNNPDIAGAVGAGIFASGLSHFETVGLAEGRTNISPYFNEASYLQTYSDVAQAVSSRLFSSGLQHFVLAGYYEGRYSQGSTGNINSETAYLQRYSDVAQAVGSQLIESGYAHYFQFGATEGRIF